MSPVNPPSVIITASEKEQRNLIHDAASEKRNPRNLGRVDMVYEDFPPVSNACSIRGAAFADALQRLLSASSMEVRVVTGGDHSRDYFPFSVKSVGARAHENTHGLARRIAAELAFGCRALYTVLAGARPQLVLVSTPPYLSALILTTGLRMARVRYVLDVRDIYPQVYAASGLLRSKSLVYRILGRLSRRMYSGATAVITATAGLAKHVQRETPTGNVRTVFNGFPRRLLDMPVVKADRFTVCFHGTLGFFQDVDTLAQVSQRLAAHDVDTVVIGYGRKAERLRRTLPGTSHFFGALSFEQTIAEVSRAHVGLCLRTNDGVSLDAFPVKVFEYLGLGIPTIVTPPCEGGAFVEGFGCGSQLAAGDVDGIVREVLRLRDDGEYYEQLCSAARALAPSFTREEQAEEMAVLLAALALAAA